MEDVEGEGEDAGEESEEGEYEIKSIKASREGESGETEFEIHWEGYADPEASSPRSPCLPVCHACTPPTAHWPSRICGCHRTTHGSCGRTSIRSSSVILRWLRRKRGRRRHRQRSSTLPLPPPPPSSRVPMQTLAVRLTSSSRSRRCDAAWEVSVSFWCAGLEMLRLSGARRRPSMWPLCRSSWQSALGRRRRRTTRTRQRRLTRRRSPHRLRLWSSPEVSG